MKRRGFLVASACVTAAFAPMQAAHAATASKDVALHTPTGDIFGTLSLPTTLPAPVVLIVPGSGPVDRDGNNRAEVQGNTYALLALALAQSGIASIRYDKRGIGASAPAAPPEIDLRFETSIDDAVWWLQMLDQDKRFTHSVLAGHSEGSLIGMVALQKAPASAFVSLEGAGRPAPVVLREQLQRNLPKSLAREADAVIAQLVQGHTVTNPPAELAALFRESVQPYLISLFKYDPAVEISKVRIPTTIVQGTADVQVGLVDARALQKGDPAARLVVIEGMNHVLKYAPDTSTPHAILAGYENPLLPIDPKVVPAITSTV